MVIIRISCLVWVLIIYSGHEICVNATDLCIQTRSRSQGRNREEVAERGGAGGAIVLYAVVEYVLINTALCLQTL